ncbi:MAG: toxin-antitoxin system HicB family antitoxin [Caldilineaceae bacterium]
MSVLSLRLPKSMHEQVRDMAEKEEISINQFILLAIAEKLATLDTVDYLQQRAARGSREQLLAILERAPDVEPDPEDRLP